MSMGSYKSVPSERVTIWEPFKHVYSVSEVMQRRELENFFKEAGYVWVGLWGSGAEGVSMDLFELRNGGALG